VKDIIQRRLESHYELKTAEDELNALKEITQEVALYALNQVGFFEKASFMGGTCLRIIHSLDRFSEDLDFSTREIEQELPLDDYLERAMEVMKPYGYDLTIDSKDLDNKSVKSRFLKDESIKKILTFKHKHDQRKKIKIKVEIDTSPPQGATENIEFVDFPEDFQVVVYDLPSLMAGKLHALLCRPYSKGRDWYDFSWYVKNNCSPNLRLLENSLKQLGPWMNRNIHFDSEFIKKTLIEKIDSLDWDDIKADVRVFLMPDKAKSLDIWSAEYFKSKVKKMTI
jgi:predicted nucleotidyltransferase component of viral defense system